MRKVLWYQRGSLKP